MSKNKSSTSKAQSYKEIGEYWDTHDIAENWEETKPAEFEVDIKSEVTYYAVDNKLSAKVKEFARSHGVSPDTLLNLWLQENYRNKIVERHRFCLVYLFKPNLAADQISPTFQKLFLYLLILLN
jgi:CopG antitoxin of type II toxin-antitoxin system